MPQFPHSGSSVKIDCVLYVSAEKRVVDLIDQYEELKKRGRVAKTIEKHRKKIVQKNRKKIHASVSKIWSNWKFSFDEPSVCYFTNFVISMYSIEVKSFESIILLNWTVILGYNNDRVKIAFGSTFEIEK